jgi:hypothetical protein
MVSFLEASGLPDDLVEVQTWRESASNAIRDLRSSSEWDGNSRGGLLRDALLSSLPGRLAHVSDGEAVGEVEIYWVDQYFGRARIGARVHPS